MNASGTEQTSNAVGRFIRRPHQVFLRRACFQVHLWAGILVSIYIAAIGVSGSVLVFKDELMPRPQFSGTLLARPGCTSDSLLAAMHTGLSAHRGATPVLATCPTEADPFYQIEVLRMDRSEVTVYVDPKNWVAGEANQESSWIGVVERFHLDLLLEHNGRQWNGVGASILIALAFTGLIIWWPGIRNWTRAIKFNLRLSWRRISFDLHSAIGIWTVAFTAVWAVTGVYFAWEAPFERIIAAISPITTARYPEEEIRNATLSAAASPETGFDIGSVLEDAETEAPGAKLEGFFFGSSQAPVFTVYLAHGRLGDYANTDFVYFNQRNGKHLLTWYRGENHTTGDWLLWLLVPLHFGTSFGMAGKILWAILGLAFPLLATTGLIMYWNRWLYKRLFS
jgi:uncharacterized iron-regulated membrane protein